MMRACLSRRSGRGRGIARARSGHKALFVCELDVEFKEHSSAFWNQPVRLTLLY